MKIKTRNTLRSKTLGVLIQDARLSSQVSVKECAKAINVSTASFHSYEHGKKSPSLPELEILAFFLDVPISHFWGTETISDDERPIEKLDISRLVGLRQKIIGALLRQERVKASISMKALAKEVSIPKGRLKAYELGERPIPLPELESLLSVLGGHLEDFFDKNGPVGLWVTRQKATEDFLNLPPELQKFVCQPINLPYLELAQNLNKLSANKLRSIAEGILDITF